MSRGRSATVEAICEALIPLAAVVAVALAVAAWPSEEAPASEPAGSEAPC